MNTNAYHMNDLRATYLAAKAQFEDAKDAAIRSIPSVLRAKGEMTAAELSEATGLTIAECAYAGSCGEYKDSDKRTAARKVHADTKTVLSHFAQVDEYGNIVPGGRRMTLARKMNVYSV